MNQYEYKYFGNTFSPRKVLQKVESYEREGWSLYSLEPSYFFFLGSGGPAGLQAVMRRPVDRDSQTEDNA